MKKSHVFLGMLICVMFITSLGGLFFLEPPTGSREPLLLLIGNLSSAFGAVVQWWFGSSSGSAAKSATIDKLTADAAEAGKL